MSDPKRLQMGYQIDKSKYSEKNLSRQYSVTTDDVAINSLSDSCKAVTKSFAVSNKGTIKQVNKSTTLIYYNIMY